MIIRPFDLADESANKIALVVRAASFAAHKHRNQRRKDADSSPYINHPLGLARVLTEEGGINDPATICAALLHDTIEDTETSAKELVSEFGEKITSIVLEVTDDKSLPGAVRKQAQIDHAVNLSDQAKLVKLADKICNLRDIIATPPTNWPYERKQEYFDWAKEVIDKLRGVNPRLEAVFDEAYKLKP